MGDSDDGQEEHDGSGAGTGVHDVSLSLDSILSILAHRHRRDLLRYLLESPATTATVEGCVGHIVEREQHRTGERPAHDQIETIVHHVPKLGHAGLIEYDAGSQRFATGATTASKRG